jgi:hypothetical protein
MRKRQNSNKRRALDGVLLVQVALLHQQVASPRRHRLERDFLNLVLGALQTHGGPLQGHEGRQMLARGVLHAQRQASHFRTHKQGPRPVERLLGRLHRGW